MAIKQVKATGRVKIFQGAERKPPEKLQREIEAKAECS
jgi:hypothetical protein